MHLSLSTESCRDQLGVRPSQAGYWCISLHNFVCVWPPILLHFVKVEEKEKYILQVTMSGSVVALLSASSVLGSYL